MRRTMLRRRFCVCKLRLAGRNLEDREERRETHAKVAILPTL